MDKSKLHIICLMKIVDDLDDISVNDYKQAGEECLDMSYVRKMINCFDEAALENALNIKDRRSEAEQETRISVITMDPGYASHFLTPFFAIKVNDVIEIQTGGTFWHDPAVTAKILTEEICRISEKDVRTIVFTGKQAPPLNSSLVPVMVADRLNTTLINEISDVDYRNDEFIAERTTEDRMEHFKIDRNVVLSFGNTKHSYLRVPTLREKMKYKKCQPEIVTYSYEDSGEEPILSCRIKEIDCTFVEYANAENAADQLLEVVRGKKE